MTTLNKLGWRNFFQAQLDDQEAAELQPARVMAVHRDRLELCGPGVADVLPLAKRVNAAEVAVGDWVLVDPGGPLVHRVLERFSLFRRRAAGIEAVTQLVAANVDTLFIVTSANRDFNVARLERYLALAHEAAAYPVVVISKADTVASVADFVSAAQDLSPGLLVEAVDARDPASVAVLLPWCDPGHTVALLGSSGVGKSTLINTLTGREQATQSVRPEDQRGRHTTTSRSMHRIAGGGWLIDTPGMRELQLVDVEDGLETVFAEIVALARKCRFADCSHDSEPGCAVREAIEHEQLDPTRLARYRKLKAEEKRNSASVAERRSRDRSQGKLYKSIQTGRRREKHEHD